MKNLHFLTILIFLFSCSKISSSSESNNSTLKNPLYLDPNGLTVKAYEWASIGDKGVINNIEYTIVGPTTLYDLVITSGDISKVCTSKITTLDGLFGNSRPIKYSIQSWDVSNVKTMRNTFNGNTIFSFPDISKWDVRNVTDMSSMFAYSNFNSDISNWNVSKVTDMTEMFYKNIQFNKDLSLWDVSNVTYCRDFNTGATNWTLPKPIFTKCK